MEEGLEALPSVSQPLAALLDYAAGPAKDALEAGQHRIALASSTAGSDDDPALKAVVEAEIKNLMAAASELLLQ